MRDYEDCCQRRRDSLKIWRYKNPNLKTIKIANAGTIFQVPALDFFTVQDSI
jgi:hypothetical protein